MEQKYYRYHYSNMGTHFVVEVEAFTVIKKTPKGVWISDRSANSGKRFVLADPCGKRYAYSTKEAALDSLKRRKKRQIAIYKSKISGLEQLIAGIDSIEGGSDIIRIPIRSLSFF